ncbi:MAG: DUF3572 domain-containing protein [Beijerinckiaceae bacterium]
MILRPSPKIRHPDAGRRKGPNPEDAEALALLALKFLGKYPDRLGRFLALSGLDPRSLRAAAAELGFLPGVLDHLISDESLLLDFAAEAGIPPGAVIEARHTLAPERDSG